MVTPILPLEAQGLVVKRRGKQLLGPVDLTLAPGAVTVVLGPNGAGKTTLLKALHGLERLTEGTIAWNAEDAPARQAFVFQTPIMLRRSVAENLAYPLRLRRTSSGALREKVAQWAAQIGLDKAMDLRATRLSGGEKQKLALARALIAEPDLLFLDEPCTNLDGRATREIEALLTRAQEAGTSLMLATHDLGQARRLAREVVFLRGGRIHETGPAARLDAPETPEFAAFLRGDIVE